MEQSVDFRDPLTGVNNRQTFRPRLDDAIARACTDDESCALLIFDLDNFKSVNDAFGHQRGDEVLVDVVRRVAANIRSSDSLFRYGGDEFVVLLDKSSHEQAVYMAERLLERVRGSDFPGTPPLSLSISIGAACYPDDAASAEELFACADRRLNQAKRAGRARVVAGDFILPARAGIPTLSRLIERDEQMDEAQHFLEALGRQRRGLLQVFGQPGMGITRFLDEVQTSARMRGYRVLTIQGSPALHGRVYGALAEALFDRSFNLFDPQTSVVDLLRTYAVARGTRGLQNSRGLVIVLDDVDGVDPRSLEAVVELFVSPLLPVAAIVFATRLPEPPSWLPQDVALRVRVDLRPLSISGVRTWLRHSLQWEAPDELIAWLHRQTRGSPSALRRGLSLLINQNLLVAERVGWKYTGVMAYPLAERLIEDAQPPPHNLPDFSVEFVGREVDLWRLKSLLRQHRIVTLIGPGGSGKTRLAAQAAAELLQNYRDGVYFVEPAVAPTVEMFYYSLAGALGIPSSQGVEIKQQVLNALQQRQILIVVDEFERLAPESNLLDEILNAGEQTSLLVTTRERLRLSSETEYELSGFAIPEDAGGLDIRQNSAVLLFEHVAQRIHSGFLLTDADLPAVGRICRMMEGMPLGIRLAATWVRTRTCAEIADDLETRLITLSGDQPDLAERHQRLAAVIDTFWQGLSAYEQIVLESMSVFRGSFHEGAAGEVSGASPFFLDALVLKGYLGWLGQRRYRMHEVLRQYAAQRLAEHSSAEEFARDHHAAYYAALVRRAAPLLRAGREAGEIMSQDLSNIRAAWEWASTSGKTDTMTEMLEGISTFYTLKSLSHEAERASEMGISGLEDAFPPEKRPAPLMARLNFMRANALFYQDRYQETIDLVQSVMPQVAALGSSELDALGLFLLGSAQWMLGDAVPALETCHRSISLAQQAGLTQLEAEGHRRICAIADYQGDFAIAREHGELGLALCRKSGDRVGEVMNLLQMGIFYTSASNFPTARDCLEQALALSHEMGLLAGEGYSLMSLGSIDLAQRRMARAEGYVSQALKVLEQMGDQVNSAYALIDLGHCAIQLGEYERARTFFERAMTLYRKIGSHDGESDVLYMLGLVEFRKGRQAAAQMNFERALEIAREVGYNTQVMRVHTLIGYTRIQSGDLAGAEDAFREALVVYGDPAASQRTMQAQAGLVRVLLLEGRVQEAVEITAGLLPAAMESRVTGDFDDIEIYCACYDALTASGDLRAEDVLRAGIHVLNERADWILDDMRRRSFLQNVPSHAALMRAASL